MRDTWTRADDHDEDDYYLTREYCKRCGEAECVCGLDPDS